MLLAIVMKEGGGVIQLDFKAHVFSKAVKSTQLAAIDGYVGDPTVSGMNIEDPEAPGHTARKEKLEFDMVVAVQPGTYSLVLRDVNNAKISDASFQPQAMAVYGAFRVGAENKGGDSEVYPQEVFLLVSTATHIATSIALLCMCIFGAII
eukprot:GHVR01078635.1.p1 GENE.GHVR01078635.1~~GHVR01078635.1.p1  ORF type:complete len:150 (+),score=33.07 GHVR01078635.1:529-978(+)